MVGLEGILDAQLDPGATQRLGRTRVDRFHAQIRQLVGDVIVGAADGHHLVRTDQVRVGAGEVEFLVDDCLAGAGGGGDLGKGDFAVAPVEGIHQAFAAVRIAGGDDQLAAQVHLGEAVADHFLEGQRCIAVPAGEVDHLGVDAAVLERQHRIEGAVRFAQRGEHFANLHQMLVELEVAIGTEALQAAHAFAGIVDARIDELVGGAQLEVAGEQLGIPADHALADGFQRFQPGTLVAGVGEALIDARFAGLFVLQQQIGHAAVGRDHEDTLIKRVAFALAKENVVQQFFEAAHGCAADLFYGMHRFNFPSWG